MIFTSREREMGLNVMKGVVYILKALIFSIKTCYRLVRYHPLILFVVLLFFLLYRFFPSVFSLLFSSVPIFVCTTVLLSTLVAFGRRHDSSQVEQKRKSSQETKLIKDDDSIIEKDHQKTSEEPLFDKMIDIKEKAVEGVNLTQQGSKRKSTKRVTFSPINRDDSIGKTVTDRQSKEIHEDGKREIDKPIGEIPDTHLKDPSGSSKELSLKQNEDAAESSGSGSNHAESSSPKASTVDINPVIDVPHQVSDPQPSQPVLVSIDEFDGAPEESDRSNDDSLESEAEKNGERERYGTKSVATWTEDDEKNLMDLGSSEMERNQRLESLMARRRARKKLLRMEAEKNLIDLDSNDPPIPMAPLSIIKTNPFDLPIADNEISALPPLPGSAPSVLVPRTNPFDLPYDPQEEKPILTGDSFHQEFMTVLQKDIYCRHESFCFGSTSYLGGLKQDKCDNNIRSYSIIEDLASTEQRSLSERSDSTSSFVPETKLQSSVPDQEDQKKPIEEGELASQIDHSLHFVEGITQSSEANLVEIHQENTRDVEINLPDVVEEKYSGSSSSSSSSSSELDKNEVQSQNVEPTRGDLIEGPWLTVKDSDLKSGITVKLKDNNQTHEPVYDSSPSAIEKRTIDESLFCVDKGVVLTSVSSIDSDLQVEVSEVSSPSASSERTTAITDEESSKYDGNIKSEDLWAASSNLCAVDENESKSKEVTDISESDVIKVELLGASKDSVDAINNAASIELQPLVESNSTSSSSMNEPIKEGLMNQIPSSSAKPETYERVHQLELEENVEPIASSSSPGQILVEKSTAQPSIDGDHHEETKEPSMKSTEEGNIINNVEDPISVASNSTPSPLMNEPITEGLIAQIPSSSAEPEMPNRVHQMNLEENVEPIASSSSPVQILVEKPKVQPSMDSDHHEEAQEPTIKSREERNIINNVQDQVSIDSNSTSSLLANEPIKEVLINQIPLASAEPEMHNPVHQLNLEENMDPIASSSSPVQILVEKQKVQPSMDSDHHEEAQEPTIKSREERNIINNVQDQVSIDSNSTSSLLANEPIKEVLINQIPLASAEPEMHNPVHQLNLEENMDPIASSSSPVQLPVEKPTIQSSMGGDLHEEAQESSIKSTEERNIYNNVTDPDEFHSNSTSSLLDEPIKEGLINQIPSPSTEPEMHSRVHQLNLEENVDPIASSSSPVQLPVKKSTIQSSIDGDYHEEAQEPSIKSSEEHNIINNVKDPVAVDSESTSSLMNEPIKEGLINHIPSLSAEPEMNNRAHQLNLEENVNSIASTSSPVQLLVEKSTVQPSMNGDHHEEAQELSIKSTEEGNIINNVEVPVAVDSDSPSLMNESVKEGLINQSPSTSAEPEIHNRVHQLNLEENVDPIASTSSPVQLLVEKSTVEPSMDSDHHEEPQEPSIKSMEEGNIVNNVQAPVAVESNSISYLMNEPIKEKALINQIPASSAEPEMHNQVFQLNLEENVDPIASSSSPVQLLVQKPSMESDYHEEAQEPSINSREEGNIINNVMDPVAVDSNSASYLMKETIEVGLMIQNSSSSAEPEMHNRVQQLNLEDNVDPMVSTSSPVQLLVEKSTVQPSMDGDHHEETQEPSIKSTDEGNIFNNLKDSILVEEEEKPKSIEEIEEDSKKSIDHQVIAMNLPESVSESNSSADHQTTESEIQKQAFEANHHLENDITSKDLHNKQEVVLLITPETILESVTVSSADHHPDHGISSKLPETIESGIQKQAFEGANHLENETMLESAGVISSADHPDDHGSYKFQETIERGIQNKEASEANNHIENQLQVTPETILESSVGVNSVDHPDDHGSNNLQQTMESGTQKQLDFEANHDLEKETSQHLNNEQEVHQQPVTPETLILAVDHHPGDIHRSSELPETMESGIQKEAFEAANHLENELTSKHEEEVVLQLTPAEMVFESGVRSDEHHQQTTESGMQKEDFDEANHHLGNEITSKHLHNEQDSQVDQKATTSATTTTTTSSTVQES